MSELFKVQLSQSNDEPKRKIKDHLKHTITQELIIGLCGPIGTDIKYVSNSIIEVMEDSFNYECIEIKLSKFIKEHYKYENSVRNKDYYNKVIAYGNEFREKFGNDILSKLAINEIAKHRIKNKSNHDEVIKSRRVCYIINSLKHNEEYQLLRKVYQNIFYFVGTFSPVEIRRKNMDSMQIKASEIETLIEIDSDENKTYGQKVSKTFTYSDYFMRIDESNEDVIKSKLTRFFDLIFNSKVITPNPAEKAMYMAASASANSACMSRQVGASITNKNGEVLSVGWNDVPKFGGNLYTAMDEPDQRCINKSGGICFNDREKSVLIELVSKELYDSGVIDKENLLKAKKVLSNSRIKDLLEFSRAVHAEMHAIINATQKSGSIIIGGKLYCTTYPCHNCARHIVATGIEEVYYIEPYAKSLAKNLHNDSITESINEENKLKILMYDGIAPRRFMDFFRQDIGQKRKANGKKIVIKRKDSAPQKSISLDAIPYLEQITTSELNDLNLLEKI